ncbi:hypothetical protein, partial [Salmonella enterica]|uniref:hypothetical protein n=1 Tax=Salmonella enterica TaxID=28901 RepID=UPI003D23CF80
MPAFEWVHVQLHQQKGMISLSPPTICNSARRIPNRRKAIERIVRINKVGDSKSSDRPGSTPPVLHRNPDGIKQAGKNQ